MGPPGCPPGDDSLKDRERNQRLREVRDEVQHLRNLFESVRKGETTMGDLGDYLERARVEIDALMKAIPGADPVRRVASTWDQVQASALIQNPRAALDAQTQLHHLNMIDALCKKLVFQVGQITIPERVNEWLRLARPGYYIPFHTVFEDELPDSEDRVKVLNYLAWAPKVLEGGLVNVEGGLIYRYSPEPAQRLLTLAGAVLAFLGALSLVVGACYLPIPDWPLQRTHLAIMLIGWVAVLIGVIVHVGVATAKRAQAEGGRPPIIAPEDALLWINARFGNIVLKMLMALIGFFALAFTAGVDKVTPFSMFLVGYSLDSVVEVFGASLEQRASAPAAILKRQISVEPEVRGMALSRDRRTGP
jgi:hypothetical protein